jgi:integrase
LFDRQGSRKYLSGPERKAYFRAVKKEREQLRRAFCLTLFHTGCRISEGLNLTVGRVDLSEKVLVFETLKRRKRGHFRSVPIPDDLVKLFARLVKGCPSSARVWKFSRATAYRLIKEVMAKAQITGVKACPKGLRHGFAIACIAENIPLSTVRVWMGHSRLETTSHYLSVSGAEERRFAKRLWKFR